MVCFKSKLVSFKIGVGPTCRTLGSADMTYIYIYVSRELLRDLREKNKVARKDAYDAGRSHPVVKRLAVRGRKSCLHTIPSRLLPYVSPQGSRRRATYKKPERVANLKLKNTPEREMRLQGISDKKFRVRAKARPEYLFVKGTLRNISSACLQ